MADYTLSAKGTYDGRDFDSGVERSSAKLDEFKGKCTAVQVALGNLMSGAIARIGSAISSSLDAAIGRVDIMNNYAKVMANLGVSYNAAEKSIDALSEKLKGLPTTLDAGVASVQRLTAKNEDIEKSTDYFLAMNNAIIAGGTSAEMQGAAIEQLSQAYSKGKMDMQEWRLMQQAMPAQLSQVAKAMNMTADELGEGLRKGTVPMESFMQTIVKLNKEGVNGFASFEEQARTATGGIATQVTNMHTAVTRAVANIIDKFNEAGAINKTIKMITNGVNVAGNTILPMAEEVGKKVSEAADTVCKALEPLAKTLPEDGKAFAQVLGAIVSGVAELVKVAAPVIPTLVKVAPLMLAAHAAATLLSGAMTTLASAGSVANVMTSLVATMNPITAAATAAAAAIGVLIVTFADAHRRGEELRNSTEGLVDASKMLSGTSGDAAKQVESVGDAAASSSSSLDGYSASVEEIVSKNSDLANSMRSSFGDVATKNAALQKHADVIAELAGKCGGSVEKMAELQLAVKSYNDIAGTSYKVTDEFSGALDVSTRELMENAAAFQAHAKAAAAYEKLKEVQAQIIETETALAEAEKEKARTYAEFADTANMNIEIQQDMADANQNAAADVETLTKELESLGEAQDNLTGIINEAGVDALDDLGESASKAGSAIAGAADSSEEAAEAFEKSLNAAYKAQQRAYDAAYKNQQRAYDAEYKARQKAYDADYKALQKSLSAEESALSKSHSKQYDELRKTLDAEYDARRDAYDAEQDALKKSLDEELSAVKKANDKALSDLKKSQDAQVSAFQAATKKRIAAIDEEYKAKLKLIEADEEKRTASIDGQIAAIEEQSKAEERERKRSEQEQRKAELQKAVNTARYASERAAREKELADYLAEIEQERVEEERAALVESLRNQKDVIKEEAAAKKEALQEDRDARKDALQATRDAQLEVIKVANEAEYETMKEALEAQETAISESNERRLNEVKTSHDGELEALKDSQQAQLDALRETQQAQEDALRESHSNRLDAMRESQQDELEALKYSQSDQLDLLKQSQQDQLETLKESQKEQLEEFKKGWQDIDMGMTGMASSAREKTAKATTNVREALEAARNPIGFALGKIREKFQEHGIQAVGDMEESGESGASKYAEAIASKEGDVSESTKKLTNSMKDAFDTVDTDGIGKSIAQGVVNGMLSIDLWTVAWNMGIGVLDAIKSALGIASPSKEAFKLFRQFDRGAIRGIDEDAGLVARSAASMARGALDAVGRMPSPAFGTIGYAGSVSAVPNGVFGSESRAATAAERGGGVNVYINEMTVRNRSDADYFAEVLGDKLSRERGSAL